MLTVDTLRHKVLDDPEEPWDPPGMSAPRRRVGPAVSPGDRAEEDLRSIRGAMERSGSSTAVVSGFLVAKNHGG
jgi:hypothetical protein